MPLRQIDVGSLVVTVNNDYHNISLAGETGPISRTSTTGSIGGTNT